MMPDGERLNSAVRIRLLKENRLALSPAQLQYIKKQVQAVIQHLAQSLIAHFTSLQRS